MTGVLTRGVIFVHSAPRALCPHLEWAASNVLGYGVKLEWTDQPAEPGSMRAELSWHGTQGSGAKLASAMRGWAHLRYEITEEASLGCDGGRWSHTPELGIFHTPTDAAGNAMIPEDRIRAALANADPRRLRAELDLAIGQAWDDELEPFRHASAGAPVRWLHRVG
ncbi:DUF3145 domain-containing protein [Rarobacter faecitabidus]|uniref:Uncharacterized protein DUF3145 n=1 Tax=Rarobacter faecitabidus TaxID=13243 RepID=A0A542ZVA8_RARFA|nr:DUF3145 domain-containing protein [Rarobacter faecitabidus]TQL64196.1 uncharacterized protein DUF3145 [Rarobacter faecitabidus]